jgi:hypothetical protein
MPLYCSERCRYRVQYARKRLPAARRRLADLERIAALGGKPHRQKETNP